MECSCNQSARLWYYNNQLIFWFLTPGILYRYSILFYKETKSDKMSTLTFVVASLEDVYRLFQPIVTFPAITREASSVHAMSQQMLHRSHHPNIGMFSPEQVST